MPCTLGEAVAFIWVGDAHARDRSMADTQKACWSPVFHVFVGCFRELSASHAQTDQRYYLCVLLTPPIPHSIFAACRKERCPYRRKHAQLAGCGPLACEEDLLCRPRKKRDDSWDATCDVSRHSHPKIRTQGRDAQLTRSARRASRQTTHLSMGEILGPSSDRCNS